MAKNGRSSRTTKDLVPQGGPPTLQTPVGTTPLTARLPVIPGDGAEITGLMFGPVGLVRSTDPTPLTPTSPDGAASPAPQEADAFEGHLAELLGLESNVGSALAGLDTAADATYDFDEYVLLRNLDDPYIDPRRYGSSEPLRPVQPRLATFAETVRRTVDNFALLAEGLARAGGVTVESSYVGSLGASLFSWWYGVCAVRAYNQLQTYSPTAIAQQEFKDLSGIAPNDYYAYCIYLILQDRVQDAAITYLTTKDLATLDEFLSGDFWEEVNDTLFDNHFVKAGIPTGDTGDDYSFDPIPLDEVLFGLQVVHRQSWTLLAYGRGELVKSIPLGPRESQKVSVKVTTRTKVSHGSEESSSYERTTESGITTKDTAEVVREASNKLNTHAEAEVSGGYGPFVQAKVSGGMASEQAGSSRDTKNRLNEVMSKTASRMKRDTKVTVSTESENTYEVSRSSELTNPNDELAVTYLYHRLQQRFWVSTRIAEVHSVVLVPEALPPASAIDEAWIARNGDVLVSSLLDPGLAGVLSAVRKEPPNMGLPDSDAFQESALAAIRATDNYRSYTGQGTMPNFLASGQQYHERDLERRAARVSDAARRNHQVDALIAHIRRNILHYMRAIWRAEDFDQRMQRYNRRLVPTQWVFVPDARPPAGTMPTPLEVDGAFLPVAGSERALTQVIDPIGPIGYLFNCAVYRLRDDPRLANTHQALAWLRAAYTRFDTRVEPSKSAGVTVRQAVAVSPRSLHDDLTLVYRDSRREWLVAVDGKPEDEWPRATSTPGGALDALGVRLWIDGVPADDARLNVVVRASTELEDPHIRLTRATKPLPAATDEPATFTEPALRQMQQVVPELARTLRDAIDWGALTEVQRQAVRAAYHEWIVLRESGRLVPLETDNVVLSLASGATPLLEPFKRLHRYIDVLREREVVRRNELDNERRRLLLDAGRLGDPDVDRVSIVSADPSFANLVDTDESDAPHP
ncbi:hypothetical protein [Cryptosporangium minutisporangium]|uniref:Uncharacterized protein n=1 Tax=Cryptosporangium minutisporangium TaxID=113569 RepID=A0ABP6SS30_9ACTN